MTLLARIRRRWRRLVWRVRWEAGYYLDRWSEAIGRNP